MPDRPPLRFSATPRRERRWLTVVGAVVLAVVLATGVWAATLAGLWGYAWLRLGGDDVAVAGDEDAVALGTEPPQAPTGAVTVLVALTEEHDATLPRPPRLLGPVVLLQYGGGREVPAVLVVPGELEVDVDGDGAVPLHEVQRGSGVAGVARALVDYTGVRIDHVAAVSVEVLPRLVEATGAVEVCTRDGCRTPDADEVRESLTTADDVVEEATAHARAVASQLDRRWAATSPLQVRRVIDVVASQVSTDASLRGGALLDVFAGISAATTLDVERLPVLVDPGSGEVMSQPEPSMVRFQHLREGTPFSPQDAGEDELAADLLAEVSVAVLNGAGVDGLAGRIEGRLTSEGFFVVGTGNAPEFDVEATVVHHVDGDAATSFAAARLADVLGDVRMEALDAPPTFEGEPVDVLVTVGADLAD